MIAGFADGVIRFLQVGMVENLDENKQSHIKPSIELIQVFKPHTAAILSIAYSKEVHMFATSVSAFLIIHYFV